MQRAAAARVIRLLRGSAWDEAPTLLVRRVRRRLYPVDVDVGQINVWVSKLLRELND